jgi:hypothetical protein
MKHSLLALIFLLMIKSLMRRGKISFLWRNKIRFKTRNKRLASEDFVKSNKCKITTFSAWIVAVVYMSLSTVLWAQEEFQARLLPGQGPSSQQAEKLRIIVDSYTSDEEVLLLIDTYNKMGYEQFRSTLHGMNKGVIHPIGGRGTKLILHAAQSTQTDKGRQIFLVAESYSWDIGTSFSFDQRFPFMVIELDINNKGKGKGKIYLSARIGLTSKGTIEMESYSSPPKQLWGVSAKK